MKNSVLSLAILGGLVAIGSTQAQTPESSASSTGASNNTNNGMMASNTTVNGGKGLNYGSPTGEIKPMTTNTGAPMSTNKYGTTGSNNRKEIKHGQ